MLQVVNLSFGYGSQPILKNINLTFRAGKITAVIGPNATGKSTLLKCIGGFLKGPGDIFFNGAELKTLNPQDEARKISYLSQECYVGAVLSVFEVVLLGMVHSLSWRVKEAEAAHVAKILRQLGIEHLAAQNICELSGGQRQMVFIAQALVRDPDILLLDEPTSSLDLHREMEMLELIKKLTVERNLTTIVTLHQLDMAARYADEIVVLAAGEVYASGRPAAVLTAEMLQRVYRVNALVHQTDEGIPLIMTVSPAKQQEVEIGKGR